MLKNYITLVLSLMLCWIAQAQTYSTQIRLNQIGFYPTGPKVAVVVDAPAATTFTIVEANTENVVFTGSLKDSSTWNMSGETVKKADFSKFTKTGSFQVKVQGLGSSYPFDIKANVHKEVGKATLKMYYFQRCSAELTPQYAGKWARTFGHPDDVVYIHPSAVTANRTETTTINSSKGWYDAGDYNKYIVNSGISTYTLLAMYERYPRMFDTTTWNIPESANSTPDLLDEIKWNLDWMLTMQDVDGGVYHKMTHANFNGSITPEMSTEKRYVVQKGTAASLDFAAVMAVAARIYAKFKKDYPGFSDSCMNASLSAWKWANKNPNVEYRQSSLNQKFNPDISTGEYGDADMSDEFQWAAIELFITTGKIGYYESTNLVFNLRNGFELPNWQKVNTLGLYSLLLYMKDYPEYAEDWEQVKAKIVDMANPLKTAYQKSAYGVPMGYRSSDYVWGSNATCANQGMLLMVAYELTGETPYMDAAIANLDYLLGRNATDYSFVTGYGEHCAMNPHHRPSESDNNVEPVPGMLVGGPQPGQEDMGNCGGKYKSKMPAKSYIDDQCSYASNEIAINWNAPICFLIWSIEANRGKK